MKIAWKIYFWLYTIMALMGPISLLLPNKSRYDRGYMEIFEIFVGLLNILAFYSFSFNKKLIKKPLVWVLLLIFNLFLLIDFVLYVFLVYQLPGGYIFAIFGSFSLLFFGLPQIYVLLRLIKTTQTSSRG